MVVFLDDFQTVIYNSTQVKFFWLANHLLPNPGNPFIPGGPSSPLSPSSPGAAGSPSLPADPGWP